MFTVTYFVVFNWLFSVYLLNNEKFKSENYQIV